MTLRDHKRRNFDPPPPIFCGLISRQPCATENWFEYRDVFIVIISIIIAVLNVKLHRFSPTIAVGFGRSLQFLVCECISFWVLAKLWQEHFFRNGALLDLGSCYNRATQNFRNFATIKLVLNVVGELSTEKYSCGIARFPSDSTAVVLHGVSRACYIVVGKSVCLSVCHVLAL